MFVQALKPLPDPPTPSTSIEGRARFFCALIESDELAFDIAVHVSNQTGAVTPKQVRDVYFRRELPKRDRIRLHKRFMETTRAVYVLDKTSGRHRV